MKRLGYRAAIAWLADNDDCCWLDEEPSYASVCACLVADIFGRPTEQVVEDLRRHVAKEKAA